MAIDVVDETPKITPPGARGLGRDAARRVAPTLLRGVTWKVGLEEHWDRLTADYPDLAAFRDDFEHGYWNEASFMSHDESDSLVGNTGESFRDEVKRYRKEHGKRYGAFKKAFAQSAAVFVRDGDRESLLIKSAETRAGGKPWRVTTFTPDGPWGHNEYKDDHEIFDELARSHYGTVTAATEDEVIAWTSTPQFIRGSAAVAMIQAENTLRFLASKHGGYKALDPVLARARELAHEQTTEAFEAATAVLERELKRWPTPNAFTCNPAWVTKAIAGSYETLNERVPPKWHPRMSRARSQRGDLIARLKEYGCGAYGCVLPTLDDRTVLKVTTDTTEADFAAKLAHTLVVPIVVEYRLVMQLSAVHQRRPVFLLWRESAEDVGTMDDNPLIAEQHRAAKVAYEEMYRTGTTSRGALGAWRRALQAMANDRELGYLASGMARVFDEQGIFFGDVHGGNVGRCVRDGDLRWVIIDPGHVSVVRK